MRQNNNLVVSISPTDSIEGAIAPTWLSVRLTNTTNSLRFTQPSNSQ
ncbi:MAG TPA: hypothetical protein IGS53_08415 [Leptolyngbyaceae cyanobacterium M33_DOE_097]|nr:hypothetical protein [Leptolyngbyaceae cyanobacterium M33_DOE_097]